MPEEKKSYEVLARKYRPQAFADVYGQDHVVRTLRNAIESERVAHAYLFVGPRGTGKTSSARIFAKALNCEKGPTLEPCNECSNCVEISEGRSLDVLEIDGASNNGVEQVRELRESVHFMPTRAKYKIYIIDEVHMLSTGAFNALLKTLEEPPSHVKFLFATTEPHKIPSTIISRVQRFDLRRIPTGIIVENLERICKLEAIKAEDKALLAVARGAEGGMRDALSALDQLIAFEGSELKEEDVLSVFGLVSHERIVALAQAAIDGEIPACIDHIASFDEKGKDLQRMLQELMEHFRNLLLMVYTNGSIELPELTKNQREQLVKQAKDLDPGRITRMVDVLIDTEGSLRNALSKRIQVEMALIRCARAATQISIDEVIRSITDLKKSLPIDGDDSEKKKP